MEKKKVFKKVLVFNPSDKKDFELVGKEKYPFDASYDSFDSQEVVRITYKPDVTKTIRPTIGVRLPFKVKDLSEYNRVRLNVYVKAQGFHNLYMHFGLPINDKDTVHAPSLKVNEWEDILWEVNHLDRSNVAYLTVIPFIGGRPAEAENEITVYISKVFFEKVESEYELGYEIGEKVILVGWNYELSPDTFDCSGFVLYVYANYYGICLPHNAAEIAEMGTAVSAENVQSGDVLCHDYNGDGYIEHVSIYIGNSTCIHASNTRSGVVTAEWPMGSVVTIRRFT